MGVSFAIPIDVAMNAVEQLKSGGRVRRGQLGVSLQPLDNEMARALGLPDARGALVNQVLPDTPAAKAGVRPGDVIRSFNGTRIDAWSDLPPMVGALPPGTRVTLPARRARPRPAHGARRWTRAASAPAATPSRAGGAPQSAGAWAKNCRRRLAPSLGLERRGRGDRRGSRALRRQRARAAPGDVVLIGRQPPGRRWALDERLSALKAGPHAAPIRNFSIIAARRPRQVHAGRPHHPALRRPAGARDGSAGARLQPDRARARHHHQGAVGLAAVHREGRPDLPAQLHRHPRPRRLQLRGQPLAGGLRGRAAGGRCRAGRGGAVGRQLLHRGRAGPGSGAGAQQDRPADRRRGPRSRPRSRR
jgi:hypothetical protein